MPPERGDEMKAAASHNNRYFLDNPACEGLGLATIEIRIAGQSALINWVSDYDGEIMESPGDRAYSLTEAREIWRKALADGFTVRKTYTAAEWAKINADEDKREARKDSYYRRSDGAFHDHCPYLGG